MRKKGNYIDFRVILLVLIVMSLFVNISFAQEQVNKATEKLSALSENQTSTKKSVHQLLCSVFTPQTNCKH